MVATLQPSRTYGWVSEWPVFSHARGGMLLMSLPSAMLELVMEHMRVREMMRMSSTCRALRDLRDIAAKAAMHGLHSCSFATSLGLPSTLSLATAEAYDDTATAPWQLRQARGGRYGRCGSTSTSSLQTGHSVPGV